MRAEGVFCIKKNLRTHIFFWVWRFSPNSGSKSPNSFFSKKKTKFKKYTHSEVEFGEFSKLKGWVWRFPRTQIQKKQNPEHMFFFTNQNEFGELSKLKCWVWRILQTQIQKNFFLSLENSPNSRVEFGEFCKLKCWVWRILQTQNQKKKLSDFFLKMHLENSQEFHFKTKTEFGEFSKLRCKISKLMFFSKSSNSRVEFGEFSKLKCWVWRILQTQIQKKKIWVWRILQTQVQNLQTHLFLKKMNWRKKTNSEAQRFSRSPMSRSKFIFFWKPWTRKKKLRDWDWVPFGFKKS